ncbi:urease accessory protein UreE [Oceaniglobus roseus]|uniref:urease accessory protein UreE n=1 Tax=Oceaniglobus roseus TaxID=1737570 RepID=UPI000C7E8E71|nr:urease accessory protein UreE [Kandeliimicrobium roseum]
MSQLPRATRIVPAPEKAQDHIALDYDARFLRRKRLTTAAGLSFLLDLPETVSLTEADALELDDGTIVAVRAAPEPLIEITAPDLARLAWHIGNRHTPCQIEQDRLLIREDHVLAAMLERLGAYLHRIEAPFRPEGGAYGHGRTLGHDHGPEPGHHHHHHD